MQKQTLLSFGLDEKMIDALSSEQRTSLCEDVTDYVIAEYMRDFPGKTKQFVSRGKIRPPSFLPNFFELCSRYGERYRRSKK